MPNHAAHQPLLPDGMAIPAQILDESRLSGIHDWIVVPAIGLQFRENVELVHNPRPDIARYKLIAQSNRAIAKNLFALLCRSTTLFKIPDSIQCSRTYARDAEEAYYIDAMEEYLRASPEGGPSELDVRDIPLLKSSLCNRMFCAFNRKAGYRSELYERRRLKKWLPSDAPENRHFDDAALADSYPDIEPWVEEIYQPPALAVPLQFSIYYYHKELRDAQLSEMTVETERIRRLRFCARKEHYILIMALWWNDVYHGGRMYVLDNPTIDILESECAAVQDIAGKPAQALVAHMRIVAGLPVIHHNWMSFTDDCMESSTFIWGIKGTGGLDSGRPAGLRFFCSKAERKVSTSKYGCAMLRRSSIMDERLSIPELDRIEGLLGLVEDRQWQAHGSMRVVDLVHHLFGLYRHNHSLVSDIRRELGHTREELNYRRQALEDTRWSLEDVQGRLQDARDRIRCRDERLDYLESALRKKESQVADLRDCIDKQSRDLQCLRSKDALRSAEERPPASQPAPHDYNSVPRSPYNLAGTTSRAPGLNPVTLSTAPPIISRSQVVRPSSVLANSCIATGNSASGATSTRVEQPASAASPCRPKRGYPFYQMPSPSRRKGNGDKVTNVEGQGESGSNGEEIIRNPQG